MTLEEELSNLINKHKTDSEYLNSINLEIGQGILESAFEEIEKYGKKVLFCTGVSSMKRLGFYDKCVELFVKHGIEVIPYTGIIANPTLKLIEKGVKIAKENKVDFIFSLGGGSVIDAGKAIACGVFGNVWDFVEKKKKIQKALPVVACSTTSGTGSHFTPYAVISNIQTREKKTLKDIRILPKLAIVEIEITKHAPQHIVASTGFDVLCHAMEVYTRKDSTEAANEFSLKAIDLVGKYLYNSYSNNENIDSKIGMAYADAFAGIALALIGTHLPHAISHPISQRFPKINHGQSLAHITPKSFEIISRKASPELKKKLETISKTLNGGSDLVTTINLLIKSLNLDKSPITFSDEDRELIFIDTVNYRWSSVERAPVSVGKEDVREIVFESLR